MMESNVNLLFLALNTGCCLGFLVRLPAHSKDVHVQRLAVGEMVT